MRNFDPLTLISLVAAAVLASTAIWVLPSTPPRQVAAHSEPVAAAPEVPLVAAAPRPISTAPLPADAEPVAPTSNLTPAPRTPSAAPLPQPQPVATAATDPATPTLANSLNDAPGSPSRSEAVGTAIAAPGFVPNPTPRVIRSTQSIQRQNTATAPSPAAPERPTAAPVVREPESALPLTPRSAPNLTPAPEATPTHGPIPDSAAPNPTTPWLLDATRFDTPVDWDGHDVPRLAVAYVGQLGFSRNRYWEQLPPDEILRERMSALPAAEIYCLDIEHLPVLTDDLDEVDRNVAKFEHILNLFREVHPGTQVGFFGLFPRYSYLEANRYPTPSNPELYAAQTVRNDRVADLAAQVDVIFPSIYAVELGAGNAPSDAAWLSRTRAIIDASRRYNKPVIAFLWTELSHRSGFWEYQLVQARRFADQVAVWGHADWYINDRWYRETLAYLENPVPYSPPAGD